MKLKNSCLVCVFVAMAMNCGKKKEDEITTTSTVSNLTALPDTSTVTTSTAAALTGEADAVTGTPPKFRNGTCKIGFHFCTGDLDESGNPFSPSWATLNFGAQYEITKALQVNAVLENITDKRYRPYSSGISAAGRNLIVAASYAF